MASNKKQRKRRAIDRKAKRPAGGPVVPRDGDRRRRDVDLVRLALERKRAIRGWTIDDGPPPPPDGPSGRVDSAGGSG